MPLSCSSLMKTGTTLLYSKAFQRERDARAKALFRVVSQRDCHYVGRSGERFYGRREPHLVRISRCLRLGGVLSCIENLPTELAGFAHHRVYDKKSSFSVVCLIGKIPLLMLGGEHQREKKAL